MNEEEKILFKKIINNLKSSSLDSKKMKQVALWVFALTSMKIAEKDELNKIYNIVTKDQKTLKTLANIIDLSAQATDKKNNHSFEQNELYKSILDILKLT